MAQATAPSPTFPRVLRHLGWRYLVRHPLQTVLMVVGITLGVAVVIAIDLANASASRAFDLSVDAVAGRATHQIVGGPIGLDESIYVDLRRRGLVLAAAPIVTEYVYSPRLGDRPFRLLGVDPFVEAPFRNYLAGDQAAPIQGLTAFFTTPGAILLSSDVAGQYGLSEGDRIDLQVDGRTETALVAGLLAPSDSLSRRALDGLILCDIATAQELTGRLGRLDRVDLILPEGESAAKDAIQAALPPDAQLVESEGRAGTVRQMTDAFRVNLTALSLLALVVGMFLIYNTMTFSVVQRRPLFGTLRALGVTRREVFFLVIGEAFIAALLGTLFGIGLGIVLGQGAVRAVTQTINDLFFVLTVRGVQVPPVSLLKGVLIGIGATVASAAPPAWEAASVPPREALSRASLEDKAGRTINGLALAGAVLILLGVGALALPLADLTVSFVGTFAVIVGFALLTPLVMKGLMRLVAPLSARLGGALGRLAPRGVVGALSRTSVAVAALMVAVSVTIGISLMVSSFRHTVVVWLEHTLQGDIYLTAPGGASRNRTFIFDPAVLDLLESWPGVERVDSVRTVDVESPLGPVQVSAIQNPTAGDERLFLASEGTPQEAWAAVERGAVIVSEPFARRYNIPRHGGQVTLYTDGGPHTFPVAGIYYDYGSTRGTVMMSSATYRELWHDDSITGVALRLAPGVDVDATTRALREAIAPLQRLSIQPNRAFRDEVLVIFDRTFAITGALNLLATLVAFVGVLSALLSLQLEKQRELGIMRAVGLTVRQLWGLVMLECGLMGAVAGLLALPTGFVLSLILVYIINRRSFGWTLQMQVTPGPFLAALAVAVVAALLAGVYPARRMSRIVTSEAIRFE